LRLIKLGVRSFRNLAPTQLDVDARFVVVHGENGHGKTNLLEAIYVLAALRPLRGTKLKDLVAWGVDEARVTGSMSSGGGLRQLQVDLGAARTASLDGEVTRDLDAYFAEIRAIAFSPSDASIVAEGPEHRRAWLDRAAFTASPGHLTLVRSCARVLAQKGAALRDPRPDVAVIEALDVQLANLGAELSARRAHLLRELSPFVESIHAGIAGGQGALSLALRSQAEGDDKAARVASLRARLVRLAPEERRRRTTLVGPQRDEVVLLLDGQPARTFASRGQVRSIVLSLKLAELEAARVRGQAPLFLLDDLSSELDAHRTARLVDRLAELDAQVVVTTTDPDHLGALPAGEFLRLHVEGGQITGR